MDFENFTDRSKGFIQAAQLLAVDKRHQFLQPEHLLKVLLDDREGLAAGLITKAGGDPQKALRATEDELAKIPQVYAQGAADQLRSSADFARLMSSVSEPEDGITREPVVVVFTGKMDVGTEATWVPVPLMMLPLSE